MFKMIIFKLLSCVLFCAATLAKDLKYIGRVAREHGHQNSQLLVHESVYYVSEDPADWLAADSACKENLGNEGHLVCIESVMEMELVYSLLNYTDGPPEVFWTGGNSPILNDWEWCGTTVNSDWWAANEPNHGTPCSRASLMVNPGPYLLADFATDFHPYICELSV